MDCNKCREKLHDYAKDSLDISSSIAVDKHLGICADCRRELDDILRLKEIGKTFDYSPELQRELRTSIMASIDPGRYKQPKRKNTNEMMKWGISMVAAGLVMMVLNIMPVTTNVMNVPTNHSKLIQSLDNFGKGFTSMSQRLIQLDGITERLQREHKGGM